MPDSLLILRLSALGDVIHTLPAVAILRAGLPDARIAWAVERPYRDLVAAVAPVDEVIPLATKAWRRAPLGGETRAGVRRVRRELRNAAEGGVAVDFQGLVKSAILGWIARASRRYGFEREEIREAAALLFINRRVAVPRGVHVVQLNEALARAVVADLGGTSSSPVPADLRAWAADPSGALAPLVAERPVVLLPGAGKPGKQWNIGRFRSLASHVADTLGHPVVVAWGPGERELAAAIVGEGGKGVLAPPTDLRQLAFLLAGARLVVGGDTGPLHLAAALGTPVLGLYGPTDPRRNGPWGQLDRVVESYGSGKTMDEISVRNVAAKAEEILA